VTINQSPIVSQHAKVVVTGDQSDGDSCDENELPTPVDPEADPLKWLDDSLPDLSGFEHRYFDLVAEFDISRYIQILADSVSDGTTAPSGNMQQPLSSGNYGNKEAGDFVPADEEWGQWS
jgi:hypothetical protein